MTSITNASVSFLHPDKTASTLQYTSLLSGVLAYVHNASDTIISMYAMRGLSVDYRIIIEDTTGQIAGIGGGLKNGDVVQDANGVKYIIHSIKTLVSPFTSETQYTLDCEQRAI